MDRQISYKIYQKSKVSCKELGLNVNCSLLPYSADLRLPIDDNTAPATVMENRHPNRLHPKPSENIHREKFYHYPSIGHL